MPMQQYVYSIHPTGESCQCDDALRSVLASHDVILDAVFGFFL